MFSLTPLSSSQAQPLLPQLVALLRDVVNAGAAVGFLPPVSETEALTYWTDVLAELDTPKRILIVAQDDDGSVLGSVQLELAQRTNGRHRAEVQKMMVHNRARRQGVGRALMDAVEAAARDRGRALLVLDTRAGDAGEALYRAHGYTEAGRIPDYAYNEDGSLHTTVIFYKSIGGLENLQSP